MDRRTVLLGLILLAIAVAPKPAASAGPTFVEGPIEVPVWTTEGSPYILLGNASVEAGRSLTIEAGVEVRAERWTGIEVFGSLNVLGRADALVTFTANASTPEPGRWRGIHASAGASIAIKGAVLEFGQSGVAVNAASLLVEDASFSENAENGIAAENATIDVRSSIFHGNGPGISLVHSQALVENSTFLGPPGMAVSLNSRSLARLRVYSLATPPSVVDGESRADIEGVLAVNVADAFGTPLAEVPVIIEDSSVNRSQVVVATGRDGRIPGIVVRHATATKSGVVDFNPFRLTAERGNDRGFAQVVVKGVHEAAVRIPRDLTPPTAIASLFTTVDEDDSLMFDASSSRDNDPSFPGTGSFRWTFPGLDVELSGVSPVHTFDTPGLVQGVLTAIDAAGNEAFRSFTVLVRDVTAPAILSLTAPERGGTGESLVFEAQASDNDPLFPAGAEYIWKFQRGSTLEEHQGPRVEVRLEAAGTWAVHLTVKDSAGNEVSAQAQVIVVSPMVPNPWTPVIGASALFAAVAVLATERGKTGLFALFLPLYTRLRDDEVLDQFTRGQIFGYVRVHPGDTYTDIKRNLGLTNGTLTYHLDVLEKQGYVRAVVRGSRKLIFPVDVTPPVDGGGLAEIQRRLLAALSEAPGIAIADLAASLGISRQLALYHVRLLAGQGLVRLERRGVRLCGVPTSPGARDLARSSNKSI